MTKTQSIKDSVKNYGLDQAKGRYETIKELVDGYTLTAGDEPEIDYALIDGEQLTNEQIETQIEELPLSVNVRGGWHTPGAEDKLGEYELLLAYASPSVRIWGTLTTNDEPETAVLQYQDWNVAWTTYRPLVNAHEFDETLLAFAHHFSYEDAQ